MRIYLLVMLAATIFAGNAAAANFEYDGWPGEGIPGFSAKGASLQLNRAPSKESEVISVPAETGENIL